MGEDDPKDRGRPSMEYGGAELDRLGFVLVDLARRLQSEKSEQGTLDAIVGAAVDTIPGAGYAAISEIRGRRGIRTTATTDELPCRVDQVQYDTDQGPCLSSLYEETTVRASDLVSDPRWPRFVKGTTELGIRSMLSFQLYVTGDNLGALNLYARRAGAFTDESEQVGLLFAAHAAVAMSDARQITQLTQALGTRDTIGQAKGILMERHRLTGEQAFHLLVLSSQHTNTKLLDVARHLVESGELTASV
ncbi:GAF domain-containing protein [Micromonospora sediminicola]|uniref:GAF domain-containing protein n=1 Tax=Micromonospora sediminicola TaxID=946078 RepID=A0A1A9BAJ0_9ACTN|nr:GAF and ANTAR domain-containing protein [Micromonospora sediminicola]SBT65994.1 GAF domain-containing protein [Micromonospora sediminicola]